MNQWWAVALLLVATVVALVSAGGVGVYGAPVLLVLHYFAARRSKDAAGRVLWSLMAGATAAMGVWGLTYLTLGESQPWISLLPVSAALVAAGLILFFSCEASLNSSTSLQLTWGFSAIPPYGRSRFTGGWPIGEGDGPDGAVHTTNGAVDTTNA